MPKLPKPLDSTGFETLFFEKEYKKSTPDFLRIRLSIIHFYLNDEENGWYYDPRFFSQDFASLNAIYLAGLNHIAETEGDHFHFTYLSSIEVALARRERLGLQLRCRPAVYLALLNVALIMKYMDGAATTIDSVDGGGGPLLLEIGQGLAALRSWSFGQPADSATIIEEMRRRGAKGVAVRDKAKRKILRQFIEARERGWLRSCKSDAAAYRSFVESMSDEDKTRYRGSGATKKEDPAAVDVNLEQSLKKAYQRYKKARLAAGAY